MKNNSLILLIIIAISAISINATAQTEIDGYELVWGDEFDTDGALDDDKWFHQTQLPSGGSWYNSEIQHYTSKEDNSYVEDGIMKIVAKKETYTDQGVTKQYTSARLNSKFAFTYGRVEVRAKLPAGSGMWPAIWMLGQNINETGAYWQTQGYATTAWPACGEIDIMEHWGDNENVVSSALHTTSSSGNTVNKGEQTIQNACTEFHDYLFEWDEEKMVFSVDGVTHYTYNPAIKNSSTWPYDANQYFILNVAIQDKLASNFTESSLEIDYIRVYQKVSSVDNNLVKSEITIYPNPTKDIINISSETDIANVTIYNSLGMVVKSVTTDETNPTIDISQLKKGHYIVNIKTIDGENSAHNLIKG
ncbi:MAG: family 16 glycosylhydrolase [Bacteroidales bacterium]